MSHLYLAPYVGAGKEFDPWRPRGSEQSGWAAIDLRPGGVGLVGRALMHVPVRDDTIGDYLGDAPDAVSAAVKSKIGSKLGLTLQESTPRQMLAELLMVHGKDDGTRWKNLRVHRDGFYRLWLGGKTPFWEAKSLAGGVDVTETFNTGASDTLGPVLTWTELEGDWDVNGSNQATASSGTPATARADTDMASDDHYCQFDAVALTRVGASCGVGPICRKDGTATLTYYLFWAAIDSATNNHYLYRASGGTVTQIGSTDTTDFVAGEVMRVEADADQITAKINGTASVGPVTDGIISGNLRGGIRGYQSGSDTITIDNVRIADLAGLSIPVAAHTYRQRRVLV